jgi:hypothetical protein
MNIATINTPSEQYAKAAREKPCIDCKHHIVGIFNDCTNPQVAPPDVVRRVQTLRCEAGRAPDGHCGVSGRYFEASQTPAHTPG